LLGKLKDHHLGIRVLKAPASAKPIVKKEEEEPAPAPPRKKNFLERNRFVNYE